MFDFRYHALSLAAVLLALLIGLLLGVAIGDAGLVSSAEKNLRQTLSTRLDRSRSQAGQLQGQLDFRNQFESQIYPSLVGGRLAGRRIGLIFFGQPSDAIDGLVRKALDQSGAQLVLVAVVREPPDLSGLAGQATPGRYTALASDPTLLEPFAVRMGVQIARGGLLIQREQGSLLSTFNGTLEPLNGVVLVRNEGSLAPSDGKNVTALESGLAAGLGRDNTPVVGVETAATTPSQIGWYQQHNLASVDDLDDIAGRTALVYALAGAKGSYGVKQTAQGLLPNVLTTSAQGSTAAP